VSITGVRLTDGRLVWVEAGVTELQPLDRVVVDVDGQERPGRVAIAPEALIRPVETVGRIVRVNAHNHDDSCPALPGADMPPLGGEVDGETVIAVDAVNRTFTLETVDGSRTTRSVPEHS
jgi:hypothetical protein